MEAPTLTRMSGLAAAVQEHTIGRLLAEARTASNGDLVERVAQLHADNKTWLLTEKRLQERHAVFDVSALQIPNGPLCICIGRGCGWRSYQHLRSQQTPQPHELLLLLAAI